VENFERKSLAWDSMGLQAHRLDAKGPHVELQRYNIEENMSDFIENQALIMNIITEMEMELSQAQKPPSMRLPQDTIQTVKPHAPKEQSCPNNLDLQNVGRKEEDPKSLS
jgi:hypothetical protein